MASKKVIMELISNYEGLLKKSPYWVKISFKAFLMLPDKIVLNTPFLEYLLGTSIDNFKMSKEMTNYGLSEIAGQKCANCIHFYTNKESGNNICTKVRGDVKGSKWCKLWDSKK